MNSFKGFLRSYDKKDVLPIFKARQKMTTFYQDKDIDILKLGCTLSNLTNICLHKSSDTKIFPFIEAVKNMLKKSKEFDVGGLFSSF